MSNKLINTRFNDSGYKDDSIKDDKEIEMDKENEITINYVRRNLCRQITLKKGGIFLMNSGSIKISNQKNLKKTMRYKQNPNRSGSNKGLKRKRG